MEAHTAHIHALHHTKSVTLYNTLKCHTDTQYEMIQCTSFHTSHDTLYC